jgi:hypothetical protein
VIYEHRCPPLRLPEKTMFCPGCLWLMPVEQWNAARFDFPCPGCEMQISNYSSCSEHYDKRRKERYAPR